MGVRGRSSLRKGDRSLQDVGKTCIDCKKYSRKTLFCTKERKVTAQEKEACVFFAPRHKGKSTSFRGE